MIHLCHCGYNVHNQSYDIIDRPNGSGDYLFLYFLAPMQVELPAEEYSTRVSSSENKKKHSILTEPNACILYAPNTRQYYGNVKIFYNSFVHFTVEESYLLQFNIPLNQIFYPKHYTMINKYIQLILNQYLSKESYYELSIHSLLTQLLITISHDLHYEHNTGNQTESMYDLMKSVRVQILTEYNHPWTIPEMAQLANLSVSRFHYYYNQYFCTSPKADLIETRLNQARLLLTDRCISIKEAAIMTGFEDIPHFTKLFRAKTGLSPSRYRADFFK